MSHALHTCRTAVLSSYVDALPKKNYCYKSHGTSVSTPQDLNQALSLAPLCWDHVSAQEVDRSAQPCLLFLDKESLQQFLLFSFTKSMYPPAPAGLGRAENISRDVPFSKLSTEYYCF